MQARSGLVKLVTWSSAAVLALLGALSASDLIEFMRCPDQYPIGAEAAGVVYRSADTFILANGLDVAVACLALFLPAAVRSSTTKCAVRAVGTLAVLAFQVFRIATIE